ncbi:MAG: DnaJ domain-containing protein [Pseudomonadales bacterium]|nr:DnaJ domain-containing protein [Pseudomonadales bacterium]MCP5185110.1 DnaJ domain-containing protein [Pseudomonadales bacterium]
MAHAPTYYELLHVHPDAPVEVIKASYRTLMQRLKMHPDLGGDTAVAARINEAYDTLTNATRRAAYDRTLSTAPAQPEAAPAGAQAAARRAAPARRVGGTQGRCPFCGEAYTFGGVPDADATCRVCDSPLRKHDREAARRPGERALPRIGKNQPLHYQVSPAAAPRTGSMRDLSLDGMLFAASEALPAHSVLRIVSDVCEAVGRVVHVKPADGMVLIGIEFITIRFRRSRGSFVSATA